MQIWRNADPDEEAPTWQFPRSAMSSLRIESLGGDDLICVDFSNGVPLPSGGLVLDAGSGERDMFRVIGGGEVQLARHGARFIRTGALRISDGVLDLHDNDLIVQSTLAARGEVLRGVRELIASARNDAGGLWRGEGLTSTAARNDAQGVTGQAAVINEDEHGNVITGVFDGQAVDRYCILVKYTWSGDANIDGLISGADYLVMDQSYLMGGSITRGSDVDCSGRLDGDDYYLTDMAFMRQTAVLAPAESSEILAAALSHEATLDAAGLTVMKGVARPAMPAWPWRSSEQPIADTRRAEDWLADPDDLLR